MTRSVEYFTRAERKTKKEKKGCNPLLMGKYIKKNPPFPKDMIKRGGGGGGNQPSPGKRKKNAKFLRADQNTDFQVARIEGENILVSIRFVGTQTLATC